MIRSRPQHKKHSRKGQNSFGVAAAGTIRSYSQHKEHSWKGQFGLGVVAAGMIRSRPHQKEDSWKGQAGLGVDAAGSEKPPGPVPFSYNPPCDFFFLLFCVYFSVFRVLNT